MLTSVRVSAFTFCFILYVQTANLWHQAVSKNTLRPKLTSMLKQSRLLWS